MTKKSLAAVAAAGFLCVAVPARIHGQAAQPPAPDRSNREADTVRTSAGELRVLPIYHGSLMLEFMGSVIHIDPWSRADYSGLPQADLILVTHTHADHLDRPIIDRLKKPTTTIVSSPAVADTMNCCPVRTVSNGEKITVMGIDIEAVPMYNLVQGPAPGQPFHHKGVGNGYVLGFGDTRLYVSGDTECVPEIKGLKNIAIAFIGMNPPRTMSTAEAAECVKAFRPAVVYPIHYRGQKPQDFAEGLEGTSVEVRIRKLEGEP